MKDIGKMVLEVVGDVDLRKWYKYLETHKETIKRMCAPGSGSDEEEMQLQRGRAMSPVVHNDEQRERQPKAVQKEMSLEEKMQWAREEAQRLKEARKKEPKYQKKAREDDLER